MISRTNDVSTAALAFQVNPGTNATSEASRSSSTGSAPVPSASWRRIRRKLSPPTIR